jgi:hypothetical protein
MKKIGITLLVLSLILGVISENLPVGFPIESVVALSFGYFLLGIYILIKSKWIE